MPSGAAAPTKAKLARESGTPAAIRPSVMSRNTDAATSKRRVRAGDLRGCLPGDWVMDGPYLSRSGANRVSMWLLYREEVIGVIVASPVGRRSSVARSGPTTVPCRFASHRSSDWAHQERPELPPIVRSECLDLVMSRGTRGVVDAYTDAVRLSNDLDGLLHIETSNHSKLQTRDIADTRPDVCR